MASWIIEFLSEHGYPALLLLAFIENLWPPIPSELIIPLGGYLAKRGELSFPLVVAAATTGSVLGALPLYWIGRKVGFPRIRRWSERHGRWVAMTPEDLDQANGWFERYGHVAVFVGRLVPGVRALISFPAGIQRMPFGRFLLYTVVGTGLWSILLTGAGWILGAGFHQIERWLDPVSWVIVAAILGAWLWKVIRGTGRAER